MSLKRRVRKLEQAHVPVVPIASIDGDEVRVCGRVMTYAEYKENEEPRIAEIASRYYELTRVKPITAIVFMEPAT